MWKIYANDKNGIAIKSSFKNVVKSLHDQTDFTISSGQVVYSQETDFHYNKTQTNYFLYFLRKRIYFEFEKELRFLILNNKIFNPSPKGIDIKVDLDSLIDKIVVSPYTDDIVKSEINSLLKKNDLKKPVILSSISNSWIKNI